MKLKILMGVIVIIIAVAGIIAIASKSNNTIDTSTKNSEPEFPEQLEKTAQPLFNQPKSEKKAIPESVASKNQPTRKTDREYLAELAGPVHNEWGIRDDILKYIEKTIPPENEKARSALIKYAAGSQFIYYKATQEEALKASEREFISLECLSKFLPGDLWIDVSRGVSNLMRNTPERDKHMWDIDEKYFGWKILGNGDLSTEQVKHMCETGDY